jgi:hypothetical protein
MRVFFTTLVMLYLALDFGDPNLPGATSFDPDESVKGVQVSRMPTAAPPALAVTPAPRIVLTRVRITAQSISRHVMHGRGVEPVPLHAARHRAPDPSGPDEA